MNANTALIEQDIEQYLNLHEQKTLLRFITCGSVDDGKSTLIGRLLYEAKALLEDQMTTLEADSRKSGTQGDQLDFALLVDGLSAEREQGITIDVAYRFFSTDKRKFIVADTPGHEQYTRNMVTGASTADVAIILVDARKGLLTQTFRHSYLVSLIGIKHVVLAVNKLDMVDYAQEVFERIDQAYRTFAQQLEFSCIQSIPLSALKGDNMTEPSPNTPWYAGPSLMQYLESVDIGNVSNDAPLRMPVQWVNRPNLDFRGFSGRVLGGSLRPGDNVRVLPSGNCSTVKRIVTFDGDLDLAQRHQSITVTLADEIDVSRGDVLVAAGDPAEVSDQFQVTLVWMDANEMLPGRPYLLKMGASTVSATFSTPKHLVDVNTLQHLPGKTLQLNDIAVCNMALDRPQPFDSYTQNRDMGSFIVIDRITNLTVGAGMLQFALRRAQNVHWQAVEVNKAARSRLAGHKPVVLWLTGLSGTGKSTIANLVEQQLHALGVRTYLLDGDNVRHGLNKDLGFTAADRVENIRRIAEVSHLMVDAGLVVISAFISPFRAERELARSLVEEGEFVEVFIDTPLAVVEQRDPKGLYKKARQGTLKNFTGIDSPYEVPLSPDVYIDTTRQSALDAAQQIVACLRERGVVAR
ncbi:MULTISPECIES: sulfate adenylyltransferase subunit CysN [unclassified Pseudomonas]|jgi:bifunctional enzyme CysN/CysC|uniref:sulfate adenylyltransferase subunit CysN n=1 Tax=unclassified Pseudomonas TaxID=196821 RepID=UPI003132CB4B